MIGGHIALEVGLEPLTGRQPPENPVGTNATMKRESASVETADYRAVPDKLGRTARIDFLFIHEALQFRHEFVGSEGR